MAPIASLSSSLEMLNVVPSCCIVFQNEKILQVSLNAIWYYYLLNYYLLLLIELKNSCIHRLFVLKTMDKHISNG